MLWTMLNAMCFLSCLFGALGAARSAGSNLVGYAIAFAIGLSVGLLCSWVMWITGQKVGGYLRGNLRPRRELYLRPLFRRGAVGTDRAVRLRASDYLSVGLICEGHSIPDPECSRAGHLYPLARQVQGFATSHVTLRNQSDTRAFRDGKLRAIDRSLWCSRRGDQRFRS